MENAIRWSLVVSRETDISLRSYLGRLGLKKGALSRFVEEAVRWRVLDHVVSKAKAKNAGVPPAELEAAINEAVKATRNEHRRQR